ncbi:hypothetical protein EZV73_16935 [Acidaminobacter sp. JC074]|uniref:hypothetical protein n=1 Tax=Acidaminobacter sp. JC074 TaxID=2530199 RepID=UPI001F0FB96F|nr:hypothetical protein [Acidaminobacter sp. JC074]MCH4889285.1 hypothetical protein [Acidaminobacter sp. JC074]
MDKLSLFEAFEKVTEKIINLNVSDKNVVSQVETLIDERDSLIKKIDETDGHVTEEVLNRIMQKNIQAETKLQEIMMNIKEDIRSVVKEKSLSSKKKKAHRGYFYAGHQNDGYFIDKKK